MQLLAHLAQGIHPFLNVVQLFSGHPDDGAQPALPAPGFGKRQFRDGAMQLEELPHFVQREAEPLAPANKHEAFQIGALVAPVARSGPDRLAQQLASLVKTHRLDIYLGLTRQFADSHGSNYGMMPGCGQ